MLSIAQTTSWVSVLGDGIHALCLCARSVAASVMHGSNIAVLSLQAATKHASLATSCSARAPPRRRRRLAVAAATAAREQWQLQDSDDEDGDDQEGVGWPSQLRASTSYNAEEADGADESRAFAIAMAQVGARRLGGGVVWQGQGNMVGAAVLRGMQNQCMNYGSV